MTIAKQQERSAEAANTDANAVMCLISHVSPLYIHCPISYSLALMSSKCNRKPHSMINGSCKALDDANVASSQLFGLAWKVKVVLKLQKQIQMCKLS